MKTVSVEFTSACIGMPLPASAGDQVAATIPAGCVLRTSANLVHWFDVATSVPFVHQDDACSYRIDCVTYTGPVTATLEISQ